MGVNFIALGHSRSSVGQSFILLKHWGCEVSVCQQKDKAYIEGVCTVRWSEKLAGTSQRSDR